MILDDVYCYTQSEVDEQLAARDAEITRLEGELRDAKEDAADGRRLLWQHVESERAYVKGITNADATIAELRAEVERLRGIAVIDHRAFDNLGARADALQAEVERLQGACDNACKVAVDASNVVHTLQADLTEARAVMELLLPWCPVDFHGSDVCRRAAAVLAKSEGGT